MSTIMNTVMLTNNLALLQLLRLCSPALPIGSYAYSQGLESACEHSFVHDEDSLAAWIRGVMQTNMQYLDLPVFARLYDAHYANNPEQVKQWNQFLLASRETKELHFEDTQTGNALSRLLKNLDIEDAKYWLTNDCALATVFSLACVRWQIDKQEALQGFLWAWCENQISIGVKLIPLGQTSGQKIISALITHIEQVCQQSLTLEEDELGASCPGLVMGSMQHEDQYSRLFRS